MRRAILLALASALLPLAPTLAQSGARIIPIGLNLNTTEGNYDYYFPFNPGEGRFQQIYSKQVLGTSIMIAGVRMRPDGLFTTYRPWPAQTATNLNLWIANHPGPQYCDRYSFAGNRKNDYTPVLLDATVNVPLTPLPASTPEPFSAGVELRFNKPFLYDGKQGLLMEFLRKEPVYQYYRWYMDAHLQMKYVDPPIGTGVLPRYYGTRATVGTGCPTSFYDRADTTYPGASMRTFGKCFAPVMPVLGVIGLNNTQFVPGIFLPLSLAPFGAANCTLYNSWDLTRITVSDNNAEGDYQMVWGQVPPDPVFAGAQFYGQAFAVDPPYNALGLRVSQAWNLRLGPGFPADIEGVTFHIYGAGTSASDRPDSWYPRCCIFEIF